MSNELLNSQSTMVEAELTLPMCAKGQIVSCSLAGQVRCEATPIAVVAGLVRIFLPIFNCGYQGFCRLTAYKVNSNISNEIRFNGPQHGLNIKDDDEECRFGAKPGVLLKW